MGRKRRKDRAHRRKKEVRRKRLQRERRERERELRGPTLHVVDYEIVFEPLPDPEFQALPAELREELEPYWNQPLEDFATALPILGRAVAQAPHIPRLWNLTAGCFGNLGYDDEWRMIAEETHRRFPDYFFGRLGVAEVRLADGDVAGVRELLGDDLVPHVAAGGRRWFHYTELLQFMHIAGRCFLAEGNFEAAENSLDVMHELDPSSPAVEHLSRCLMKARLARIGQVAREGFRRGFEEGLAKFGVVATR